MCSCLHELSRYVRDWLERQPAVKEESLTDWLLLEQSRRLPNVFSRAFTRHEEARGTGADWEWWFLFPWHGVRFRVQAKKVSVGADNYAGLAHTNRHGLQIEKLLASSTEANAIPLYAFYCALDEPTLCGKGSEAGHGVFMAGGHRVHDSFIAHGRQMVTGTDLLRITTPFPCFACCPLVQREGFRHFLERYYPDETDGGSSDSMVGVYEELPTYLLSFLEHARQGLPSWWESEFRWAIKDFNGLVVFDRREECS